MKVASAKVSNFSLNFSLCRVHRFHLFYFHEYYFFLPFSIIQDGIFVEEEGMIGRHCLTVEFFPLVLCMSFPWDC